MDEPKRAEKSPEVRWRESGGEEKPKCSVKLPALCARVKGSAQSARAAFYACNVWPTWLGRVWLASKWTRGGSI